VYRLQFSYNNIIIEHQYRFKRPVVFTLIGFDRYISAEMGDGSANIQIIKYFLCYYYILRYLSCLTYTLKKKKMFFNRLKAEVSVSE
jgi:hypothetical protein